MTLLAPGAMLIGAALAVPTLVALYLLKLRRKPVRVSTLLFWTPAARDLEANVPLRWLRPSWLLLLHLLILAAALLALGRPAIEGARDTDRRVYVVLDRSASMQASDAPGGETRWDEATRRARAWIEQAGESGAEVVLISSARRASLLSQPGDRPALLRGVLEELEPTDERGTPALAFELIENVQRAGTGGEDNADAIRAEVVFFSDGGNATGEPWRSSLPVRYERVGPADRDTIDNVGIVSVAARRDAQDPALVRLFAGLAGRGPAGRDVPVALLIDGVQTATRAVRLEPNPSAPEDVASLRGSVVFEVRRAEGGLALVRLDRPDALPSDDAAGLWLRPGTARRVLLVEREPGASWALEDVLEAYAGDGLVSLTPEQAEAQAAANGLAGYDAAVFLGVTPPDGVAAPVLSFGAPSGTDTPTARTPIVAWERDHPALRSVSVGSVFVGRASNPAAGLEAGRYDVLASGQSGPLIVETRAGGVARLIVGFEPDDSTWPLDVGFSIFVASTLDWLSSRGDEPGGAGWAVAAGKGFVVEARRDTVRVLDRDGSTISRAPAVQGLARVPGISRAGVYALEGSVAGFVPVSVLDGEESLLDVRESLPLSGGPVAGTRGEPQRVTRELWRECLALVGLLLMLEWFIYAWRMRA